MAIRRARLSARAYPARYSGKLATGSAFLLSIYLFPFIIAKGRGMRNAGSILVLNLFLGWTLLGWVVALSWAVAGTAEIKTAGKMPI